LSYAELSFIAPSFLHVIWRVDEILSGAIILERLVSAVRRTHDKPNVLSERATPIVA
jgi:hypothetical protein